jgi:NADPH oxidase
MSDATGSETITIDDKTNDDGNYKSTITNASTTAIENECNNVIVVNMVELDTVQSSTGCDKAALEEVDTLVDINLGSMEFVESVTVTENHVQDLNVLRIHDSSVLITTGHTLVDVEIGSKMFLESTANLENHTKDLNVSSIQYSSVLSTNQCDMMMSEGETKAGSDYPSMSVLPPAILMENDTENERVQGNEPDMIQCHPYAMSSLDTALFHFLLGGTWPVRQFYKIRSLFSLHLSNFYIIPKFIPHTPLPIIKHLFLLTIGELLMFCCLLFLVVYSYEKSFRNYDVMVSGKISEASLLMIFLMANRTNSLFTFMLGIPFERMIKWHIFSAVVTIITSCFHTYAAFLVAEREQGTEKFAAYLFQDDVNASGSYLFLTICALTIPNIHPFIRRKIFEYFYITHIILAIFVLVISLVHALGMEKVVVAAWWFLDVFVRYVIMARFRYKNNAALRKLQGDVVEISFPKPSKFDYMAGQYVMICIPKLSAYEFHPFSISSAPHEAKVTLHVRALGGWTKALAKLATKKSEVKVLIEGPYGNLSVDLDNTTRYKMVLLISGGIGITPMQSICNNLIHQVERQGREMKKLYFLWVTRDKESISSMTDSHWVGKEKYEKQDGFTPDLLSRKNTRATDDEELSDDCNGEVSIDGNVVGDAFWGKDFLHTEYYVTNRDRGEEWNSHTSRIQNGRPDWDAVLGKMRDFAEQNDERRIAVCVCGPTRLVDDVSAYCRKYSSPQLSCNGVQFDVHKETFEL